VAADGIIQYDGSGLSRHNLITPSAVVQLYTYMAKQSKYSQAWRDSLTIGGVDGTLRNRFKGTAAAGNIRGKTGTIDQVSALSGYLTTAAGEQLVLSILVNGVAKPSDRTGLIDDIVLELANYKGRID
jgi:D-alanyl-D-alanine carboxypeptidase/D-alanyl-D-alanine-endopeptidase (penicillin-binding protein 4)